MQSGACRLHQCLADAAETEDVRPGELTVLSPSVDPYRFNNSSGNRIAAWCAEQVGRSLPSGAAIHLRGLHYAIASAGSVPGPEGKLCINTDRKWLHLCRAAKAARRPGYMPFDRIKDERNQWPPILSPRSRRHQSSCTAVVR